MGFTRLTLDIEMDDDKYPAELLAQYLIYRAHEFDIKDGTNTVSSTAYSIKVIAPRD
jgi:hypothetical protein